MDNANGLAEICEKCDEQKNSKLAELYIWKIMRCTMCILQLNFRYKFQTLQSISTTLQATTVWGASCMIFLIKRNKLVIHIICETIYNVILGALMQVWRRNKMTRARGHWKKGEHTVQGSHSDMFGPKAGGDISTSPHLLAFNKTARSHKFTMGINNGSTVFWLVSPFSTKN